jgi:ABC-type nitrate/sulfonate/bicarbonate transport system substrate-binding protein
MIDTDHPAIAPKLTAKLLRACELASAQLEPLVDIVAPLAKSRPDAPVPADLLALARRALRASAPIARWLGAPAPLPLHPPVTHAGLAARLALAAQQATAFRRRHAVPVTPLEAITWHAEDQMLALTDARAR